MSRRRSAEPPGLKRAAVFACRRPIWFSIFRAAQRPCRQPRAAIAGAIAQLGERYNGIVEVTGSIPVGSTNQIKGLVNDG
jgi:hypothetical protein